MRTHDSSTRWPNRVTSPFPRPLHRKSHHIYCPGHFRDVYGRFNSDSRPYDAIADVFLALPPVPVELHALRLHLACSGRLFQDNLFSFGQLRSLGGRRYECNAANKYRGGSTGDQSGEMVRGTLLLISSLEVLVDPSGSIARRRKGCAVNPSPPVGSQTSRGPARQRAKK